MSFVVIQHLSPDFRSLMDELIARHSDMPVLVVEDGMRIEPDHIYLLPPRKEMSIRGRQLMLTDKPHGLSLPIDLFFRSLAQDVGHDAVAIVLSGSGSDGSRGIVDIKRAGGLVMAESFSPQNSTACRRARRLRVSSITRQPPAISRASCAGYRRSIRNRTRTAKR
jgi:two-component system CheB/CheR fusion protein